MDAETSSRLREHRPHHRAQITKKWRERVMKELEKKKSNRKDKEKAPQMTKEMEGHMGSQDIGGTIKEVW